MEKYIRAGFQIEKIENYNCGVIPYSLEQWYSLGRQNNILGITMLSYGIIVELCYVFVMLALWKRMHLNSCYKIMVLLGIFDMLAIVVNSIITGILFLQGANFCTNPDLIYISGSCGLGLWCGACLLCLILVINRLCDLWKANMAEMHFGGRKIIFWFGLPIVYCLYFTFFTPPLLFNSSLTAWFFSPMILQTEEEMAMFYNIPHTINNLLVVVATCLLYILLCFVLGHKYKFDLIHTMNRVQRMIMLQSVLICSASLVASIIYAYMQFFPTPIWVILVGHIAWQASHGIPAFVYLLLNPTIRRDVAGYVGLERFVKVGSSTHPTFTTQNSIHI